MAEPTEEQYQIMLIFHCALRNFQRWSAEQAAAEGLTSSSTSSSWQCARTRGVPIRASVKSPSTS